jgi:hypothetical protein
MNSTAGRVTAITYDTEYALETVRCLKKIQSYKNIKETSRASLAWLDKLNANNAN